MNEILQLNDLLAEIENLREEVEDLYNKRSLNDSELIKKSQELDEVLNKYNKIIDENTKGA